MLMEIGDSIKFKRKDDSTEYSGFVEKMVLDWVSTFGYPYWIMLESYYIFENHRMVLFEKKLFDKKMK